MSEEKSIQERILEAVNTGHSLTGISLVIVSIVMLVVFTFLTLEQGKILDEVREIGTIDSVSISSIVPLVNPDFEGDYYCFMGDCMMTVPGGWEPKWIAGVEGEATCPWPCIRPEYQPEYGIVQSGQQALHYHATYARMRAGLCEQVDVTKDHYYEFFIHAYVVSEPNGEHTVQACIIPWGQYTDRITDLSVTCGVENVGETGIVYREWLELSSGLVRARSNKIWVCGLSQVKESTQNQTAILDNARLIDHGPNPFGGSTPMPTYTPYPTQTALPTWTPVPTSTMYPTFTPIPTSVSPTATPEQESGVFYMPNGMQVQWTRSENGDCCYETESGGFACVK